VFLYFWNFFLKGFLPERSSTIVTPRDHQSPEVRY
jgi:hypothetical protein